MRIAAGCLLLLLLSVSGAARTPALMGVNLPSAAFGDSPRAVYEKDYVYPDSQDIDYFVNNGMNVIRLSFMWERLQPSLNGPLDATEFRRLDDAVAAITLRRAMVVLDPHNYARYDKQPIGTASVPNSSFADLWRRLAAVYNANDRVIFGLMNEPYDIPASQWLGSAQTAISAIRAEGARNLILVPGTYWDSAKHFVEANGNVLWRISDPADNYAYEVHQYIDDDTTGTHPTCPRERTGINALRSVSEWARAHHRRLFLGEFGAGANEKCLSGLRRMLTYMHQRPDVWLGWTYWAGGPKWGDYMYSVQPAGGRDKPQMVLLKEFLAENNAEQRER